MPKPKSRDEHLSVRVPTALKRWIERQAHTEGRSMSDWICRQLERIRKEAP
ncbi:MAG TPA: hypothetical protein VMY05_05570 [Acidobacteriota bacterium]|nr:hypothetical protein [Acidobacteriota bacterium]